MSFVLFGMVQYWQQNRKRHKLGSVHGRDVISGGIGGGKVRRCGSGAGGGHRGSRFKVELLDFTLTGEATITEDRLPLNELPQNAGDGDFLRAVAESVLQLLMEAGRRGADRRWPARTGRRSAELAQRLPRPHARHAAWLAQPQDPEAAARQLLPAVPGGAQDDGKGVGRRHPGGLDRRGVDPPTEGAASQIPVQSVNRTIQGCCFRTRWELI